jgi:hypothetical protein
MKRLSVVASVVVALLTCVLLARAARTDDGAGPSSPSPAVSADAAALDGSAGWHYRHSQPTHWRACMLQP